MPLASQVLTPWQPSAVTHPSVDPGLQGSTVVERVEPQAVPR